MIVAHHGDGGYVFKVLPFLTVPSGAPDPEGPFPRRITTYPTDRRLLLTGLDWLLTVNCDVLNLSTGPRGLFSAEDPLQIATRAFVERGKVVIVAAGNYGPGANTLQALARPPWVLSVAAVDENLVPLLDSSRGTSGIPGPTCSSYGANDFEPGKASTSFSAPRVAMAAAFAMKCLQLLVADLSEVIAGTASAWSRPVTLPWIGFADTGWDPERAPYRWRTGGVQVGSVAASLLPHTPAIELAMTEAERSWAESYVSSLALDVVVPQVTPELVARALRLSALPINAPPEVVGWGLVTKQTVAEMFRDLTPSTVSALLGFSHQDADPASLDVELGTY